MCSDKDLFDKMTKYNALVTQAVPEVHLLQLVRELTNQPVALPDGFDLAFVDSTVLIRKSPSGDFTFLLGTSIPSIGLAALEVRRVVGPSTWGFAAAIELSGVSVSSVPGLGSLKMFEDMFRLDQLVVVVASFADPTFQFPSLATFNSPVLPPRNLSLPSQGGVIAGLNVQAQWTLDTSKEQKMLQKLLGLKAQLAITLQVGKIPSQDSRLYVGYTTTILKMPLSCEFGGQIKNGKVGLFLEGELKATIQGQPANFQVQMVLVPTGALISGSTVGSVSFEGLTLSNLALVIGSDWEGIPSLGIACNLTMKSFNSALAVFFDSTDPSHSLVAGAVSDLSLLDVVTTLARTKAPPELNNVLRQIALLHTRQFMIDGALAGDLENRTLERVAKAFQDNGVTLSTAACDVLLVTGLKGSTWFLTNMVDSMMHYELTKGADGKIRVMLNPQLYCVPQRTNLGQLTFDQGFFLTARLKVLEFDAQATVLVNPAQGILVDGAMTPIVVWKAALFSLTSTDGTSGPRVSIATFARSDQTDPTLRGPHCLIDGQMTLLGVNRHAFVTVSEKEFQLLLSGPLMPAFTVDIKGRFTGVTDFSAGGEMHIGVGNVDLGRMGKANIASGVAASLDAGYDGSVVWAKVAGSFQFLNQSLQIPPFDLDLDGGLPQLPKRIADEASTVVRQLLTDSGRWAEAIGHGAVTDVGDMAHTLRDFYHVRTLQVAPLMKTANQSPETVAAGLKSSYAVAAGDTVRFMRGAGYPANDVGKALKSAYGTTTDQVVKLLHDGGYAAREVGDALKSTFGTTAEQTARALRSAGYAAKEAGGFVKDAFGLGPDALKSALSGAGYADDQIKGFFNDLGGSFKDALGSVVDKLDPRKW